MLFPIPQLIFYSPQKKTNGKNVTIYSPEDLFITPSIGLTRGGILLIALLAGGDYHIVCILFQVVFLQLM
jgi:hypothetical protein